MRKRRFSKRCSTCKQVKLNNEFHRQKTSKDGYCCQCKDCRYKSNKRYFSTEKGKATMRRYASSRKGRMKKSEGRQRRYHANLEESRRKGREASRRYRASTDNWRVSNRKSARRYRRKNPEKSKAHEVIHTAIRRNKIKRPEICEMADGTCEGRIEGHHPDYSDRKMVMWLCLKHHREVHRRLNDAT